MISPWLKRKRGREGRGGNSIRSIRAWDPQPHLASYTSKKKQKIIIIINKTKHQKKKTKKRKTHLTLSSLAFGKPTRNQRTGFLGDLRRAEFVDRCAIVGLAPSQVDSLKYYPFQVPGPPRVDMFLVRYPPAPVTALSFITVFASYWVRSALSQANYSPLPTPLPLSHPSIVILYFFWPPSLCSRYDQIRHILGTLLFLFLWIPFIWSYCF